VKEAVERQIKEAIAKQVNEAVEQQTKEVVERQIKEAIAKQVKEAVDRQAKEAVERQVKEALERQAKEAVEKQMSGLLKESDTREEHKMAELQAQLVDLQKDLGKEKVAMEMRWGVKDERIAIQLHKLRRDLGFQRSRAKTSAETSAANYQSITGQLRRLRGDVNQLRSDSDVTASQRMTILEAENAKLKQSVLELNSDIGKELDLMEKRWTASQESITTQLHELRKYGGDEKAQAEMWAARKTALPLSFRSSGSIWETRRLGQICRLPRTRAFSISFKR
jgi:hypothetical protein